MSRVFIATASALRVEPGHLVLDGGEFRRVAGTVDIISGREAKPCVEIVWEGDDWPPLVRWVAEKVIIRHADPGLISGPNRPHRVGGVRGTVRARDMPAALAG